MKVNQMLTIETSPTLDDLLRGCRKGRSKAQKGLYDRMSPKMLGVCMRYLQDREEAEHVMIGGFVKVFEKIAQYKSEGSFEGWIRKIMVNESLMYLRKNQALFVEIEVDRVDKVLDYEALDSSLQAEDLMKMIHELPVGYKTVFNLYAIEGFNHAEIAEQLGISESTSKSQLSRARKLLQHKLATMESIELRRTQDHGK